ncbi:pentapeptide repeat-containing protein [Streptomyces sp. NPDC051567]|uniref:pentapeptide repeat-containing protein n=1 Tax=Streptomyces sp. NPDC051567 TaxID=3365660 RepID=UPI00378975A8
MATRTFGRTTLTTPDLDEPGLYLSNVGTLDSPRGALRDFAYGDARLRAPELADTQLITGRIHGVTSRRTGFDRLGLHGVEITTSDLGAVRWAGSKLTRVTFRNCKLLGAAFEGLALDDVLFEGCELDLATFGKVRATGPVVFAGCSLTEAEFSDCDPSDVTFSGCALRHTVFGPGRYRHTDLRGNTLTEVRGVANLAKVRIDHGQQADLAEALVAELDVAFGDD